MTDHARPEEASADAPHGQEGRWPQAAPADVAPPQPAHDASVEGLAGELPDDAGSLGVGPSSARVSEFAAPARPPAADPPHPLGLPTPARAYEDRRDPTDGVRVAEWLGDGRGEMADPVSREAALDYVAATRAPHFALRWPGQPVRLLGRVEAFRALAAEDHDRLAIVAVWDATPANHDPTDTGAEAIAMPDWLSEWEHEVARREARARTREQALDSIRDQRQQMQHTLRQWLDQHRMPPSADGHHTPPVTLPILTPAQSPKPRD